VKMLALVLAAVVVSGTLSLPRERVGVRAALSAPRAVAVVDDPKREDPRPALSLGRERVPEPPVHFAAIDIYLDPQGQPLAAYQFEFTAKEGQIKVVGVGNGEHPAFRQPPYCDRAAMVEGRADRIIVAAFNTAPPEDLPTAKTRVTTIHLQYTGDTPPQYAATLTVAVTADGTRIPAQLTFSEGP
jgi:hypothetical protein